MRSDRIVKAGELAFGIIADFTKDERVLSLPQQQEVIGVHPHDFMRRRQPSRGDVVAGALGVVAVAEDIHEPPASATLATVRDKLTRDPAGFAALLADMQASAGAHGLIARRQPPAGGR